MNINTSISIMLQFPLSSTKFICPVWEASVCKVRWPFLLLLGTLWVLLITWGQSEYNLQQSFQVSQLIVANVFTSKTGIDPCSGHAVNENLGSPKAVENETVLVTGGSGFIGSHLVEMLLDLGYTVRVYDNLETGNLLFLNLRHPRLHFVYGDIMDMDSMRHQPGEGGKNVGGTSYYLSMA